MTRAQRRNRLRRQPIFGSISDNDRSDVSTVKKNGGNGLAKPRVTLRAARLVRRLDQRRRLNM